MTLKKKFESNIFEGRGKHEERKSDLHLQQARPPQNDCGDFRRRVMMMRGAAADDGYCAPRFLF